MYMGVAFGCTRFRLCDFFICKLVNGVSSCADYIGKGQWFNETIFNPTLDLDQGWSAASVNYTKVYKPDEFWAPAYTRLYMSPDTKEDLNMGVGNTYYVWGFYGKLDSNGNMLMPGVNDNPGFLANT